MARAILFFEDIEQVVRDIVKRHLKPKLEELKKLNDCKMLFVSYCEQSNNGESRPLGEETVAASAAEYLKRHQEVERAAFIMDLSPDLSPTPDRGYGLRVLEQVVKLLPTKATNLEQFLALQDWLVILLSVNLKQDMTPVYHEAWSSVPGNLLQIRKPSHKTVADAVAGIKRGGPRIVVADRGSEKKWVSDLLAEWL